MTIVRQKIQESVFLPWLVTLHNPEETGSSIFLYKSDTLKQLLRFAPVSVWPPFDMRLTARQCQDMWKQKTGLETSIYTNVYKDTTNRLYGIWNLLLQWKCSVFRLIWHDLVVFLVLYFALSILYR